MSDRHLKARVLAGAAWATAETIAFQVIVFGIFMVMARLLEPVLFGLVATASLFVQVFKTVVCDSIAAAVIRKPDPQDIDYDTAFILTTVSSLPVFLVLFFLAGPIESFFATPGLRGVMQGIAIMIVFTGLTRMHEAWLARNLHFKPLALRSIISMIIGGAIAIGMAWRGYGVASLVVQQVVQAVVSLIMLWAATPWRPHLRFSMTAARDIYRYGRHIAVSAVTGFAAQNSEGFFITYFLGPVQTAVYNTGKRLLTAVLTVFSGALQRVAVPAFAQIQGDPNRMSQGFLLSVGLTATSTAPIFAGLACVSYELTMVLFGEKWIAAAPITAVLALAGFVQGILNYNGAILLALNKPHWQSRLAVVFAVSSVLIMLLITRYGLMVTAVAFTLRTVAIAPISTFLVFKLLPINLGKYLKAIFVPVVAATVMSFCVIVTRLSLASLPNWERLIAMILVGSVVYTIVMYFIGRSEIRQAMSLGTLLLAKRRR
ncbi:MAG: lipopolysaccharide biosynthesis protein [Dongiaceae bacterium]